MEKKIVNKKWWPQMRGGREKVEDKDMKGKFYKAKKSEPHSGEEK